MIAPAVERPGGCVQQTVAQRAQGVWMPNSGIERARGEEGSGPVCATRRTLASLALHMTADPSPQMLRGAVIGLGMIGRHHARLLQSTPRVRFAGAVDPEGDHYGSVHDARLVFGSVADLLKALSPPPGFRNYRRAHRRASASGA